MRTSRLSAWAAGWVAVGGVALACAGLGGGAGRALAQDAPPALDASPYAVAVRATVGTNRRVTVSMTTTMQPWAYDPEVWGDVATSPAMLSVSLDRVQEECPADPDELPAEGWWLTGDPDDPWDWEDEAGAIDWSASFVPGPAASGSYRVCAYLQPTAAEARDAEMELVWERADDPAGASLRFVVPPAAGGLGAPGNPHPRSATALAIRAAFRGKWPPRCDVTARARRSRIDPRWAIAWQDHRVATPPGCTEGDGYIIVKRLRNGRWVRTFEGGGAGPPCRLMGRRVSRELFPTDNCW